MEWRNTLDRRPVLILSPQWYIDEKKGQDVLVAQVSSATGLYDPDMHFPISSDHPEFPATGLKRSSFVAADYITHLTRDELKHRIGELGEENATSFKAFLAKFLQI